LGLIFAAKKMAVIAPDFLGMGTSRGFHPYVHARTEATASVDMMDACLAWMQDNDIIWNEQLFITGYSQGGHAAMALHEYIQQEIPDRYTVTASLPMSGPYSISGVMRDLAFADEPYGFIAYLVYSTRALREIYPDLYQDESQIFQEAYIPAIRTFLESGNGLFDLNDALVSTLIDETGSNVPKRIYRDSVLTLLENDPNHPFNLALAESDVFDWTPEAPVLMLYCPDDDQVPFTNSTLTDSVMNARGAENVMSMDVSEGRVLDHSACIVPALNTGIPWLLSFVDTTTPVPGDPITEVKVFPNPASDLIIIEHPEGLDRLEVFDLMGRMIFSSSEPRTIVTELDISNLATGVYLFSLESSLSRDLVKVVVD